MRESGLGATAHVPGMPESHPGWEDAAVPPDRVGDYLRDFRDLLDEFGYHAALYGHFGQGCIHCRIDFTLDTVAGVDPVAASSSTGPRISSCPTADRCRASTATARRAPRCSSKMYGDELVGAFARFKDVWDPGRQDEPGEGGTPVRARREPAQGSRQSSFAG